LSFFADRKTRPTLGTGVGCSVPTLPFRSIRGVQSEAFSYIRSDLELFVKQKDIKVEIDDFLE
jgi:hypothetical protein